MADYRKPGGGGSNQKPRSNAPPASKTSQRTGGNSQAVVPRKSGAVVSSRGGSTSRAVVPRQSGETMLAPKGYTMRQIQPAKNYDVVSFARAMNQDDFGPRVKKLFDPEREAAIEAQETGVYIGWRCPEYKWDCQRVSRGSKCFCGHMLTEHADYHGNSVQVPCRVSGCICKAFAWVATRPEDVGEFWLPKRRDFDPAKWRLNCRCKHTHEEHMPNGSRRCQKCGCGRFNSMSVCAACDRHWEEHETFFDTTQSRKEKGLPYGADYLPFAEIPSLRNMVLTGEDDGDMSYMRLQERVLGQGALPPPSKRDGEPRGNSTVVPYRGGAGNRQQQQQYAEPEDVRASTNRNVPRNSYYGSGAGAGYDDRPSAEYGDQRSSRQYGGDARAQQNYRSDGGYGRRDADDDYSYDGYNDAEMARGRYDYRETERGRQNAGPGAYVDDGYAGPGQRYPYQSRSDQSSDPRDPGGYSSRKGGGSGFRAEYD